MISLKMMIETGRRNQIIPSKMFWTISCDWAMTISSVTWVQPNMMNCWAEKVVAIVRMEERKGVERDGLGRRMVEGKDVERGEGKGCGKGREGEGCGKGREGEGCEKGREGEGCGKGEGGVGCRRGKEGKFLYEGSDILAA